MCGLKCFIRAFLFNGWQAIICSSVRSGVCVCVGGGLLGLCEIAEVGEGVRVVWDRGCGRRGQSLLELCEIGEGGEGLGFWLFHQYRMSPQAPVLMMRLQYTWVCHSRYSTFILMVIPQYQILLLALQNHFAGVSPVLNWQTKQYIQSHIIKHRNISRAWDNMLSS